MYSAFKHKALDGTAGNVKDEVVKSHLVKHL